MEKRCVECIECYEYNSQEEMELHRREAEQLGHISNDPPYEEQKEEEAHPDTTRIPVKSTTGILKNQKLHILPSNGVLRLLSTLFLLTKIARLPAGPYIPFLNFSIHSGNVPSFTCSSASLLIFVAYSKSLE